MTESDGMYSNNVGHIQTDIYTTAWWLHEELVKVSAI